MKNINLSPNQKKLVKYTSEGFNNFDIQVEILDMFIQCFWDIMEKHRKDKVNGEREREAKLVLQMMFSKLLHLKKWLEGINFKSRSRNSGINDFIDPTIISALVRNIFELVCLFHLVYRIPETEDEKQILYKLWVIAGLKYRQNFTDVAFSKESQEKAAKERLAIDQLISEIENTSLFQNMDERNQEKIRNRIKAKDYKIKIIDNKVKFLSWQDIANEFTTSAGSDVFKRMYTYFSLNSHPSNVSVFQFKDMFKNENETMKMIVFNLKFALNFSSIFLADLIKMFPTMLLTFERKTTLEQALLNFNNRLLRGDFYSINNAMNKL